LVSNPWAFPMVYLKPTYALSLESVLNTLSSNPSIFPFSLGVPPS